MRSIADVRKSARHNETKAKILFLIIKTKRYLTSPQIAEKCNMTNNNASRQMTKLSGQGYVWVRSDNGTLKYQYLKPMGIRTCKELWIRIKLREIDSRVSLNLKNPIPFTMKNHYEKLKSDYYSWLWS